jgi:integrase
MIHQLTPHRSNVITFPRQEKAIALWLEEFETDYFNRRQRSPKSETTWRGDYQKIFQHLPGSEPLSVRVLMNLILETTPDTRTRRRACIALGALAKFAKLDFDAKPYIGCYSPKLAAPRVLPDDQLISQWFNQIKNPSWRWVYGMLACYGLRPHEVFWLDTASLKNGSIAVSVLDGKTGARQVHPFYPEWVQTFGLNNVCMPDVKGKDNSDLGSRVRWAFRRADVPFSPYDLRHCWAVRTLRFDMNVSLAARQMGHSVKVHTDIYHRWITERQQQQMFEALMRNPDRPQPPS